MPTIRFTPMPGSAADAFRAGGPDANGQRPERAISDGEGNPCRRCLREIPKGAPMLILAWRPFAALQPYAETGPVFLCADHCEPNGDAVVPEILTTSPRYMLRGYGADERIVYGTGAVVPAGEIEATAARLLDRCDVAFVHVRSARNGCFQCRIDAAA